MFLWKGARRDLEELPRQRGEVDGWGLGRLALVGKQKYLRSIF